LPLLTVRVSLLRRESYLSGGKKMMQEKQQHSAAQNEAQAAFELPDREMMALVNITLIDVLSVNEVAVQVPIGIAANVCGVQANVLAQGNMQGPIDCTAATTQDLPVAFRP
jgi:hypothetical protein